MEEEDEALLNVPGQRRPLGRQIRPVTFTEMTRMLRDNTPSQILQRISREDDSLQKLLDAKQTAIVLKAILKVLVKALDSSNISQPEGINYVIQTFLNSKLVEHLEEKVATELRQDAESIKAVLMLMKISLEKLPNRAPRVFAYLGKILERLVLETHSTNAEMTQLYLSVNDEMNVPLRRAEEEQRQQQIADMMRHDTDVDPDLFRGLSIIPSAADFDATQDIQVRANKIVGGYDNVNDYLDIQFRLLRADLILPLRENILEYQAVGGETRGQNLKKIRVYSQVRIVRPVCHDNGLSFRLSFDVSKLKVNWKVSQRLKYGSLLCLSCDNFATYRCAVVENREPKDLKLGLVDVNFIAAEADRQEDFMRLLEEGRDKRYVMVESPSYFEAYQYVLRGIQNITEDNFPFWRYIGRCQKEVDPPRYLTEAGADVTFDLRPLIDENFVVEEDGADNLGFSPESQVAAAVKVQDLESWPRANAFNLDFSQFSGLQNAFTREFSIIQGPPGTGKTFIGLKVMKALLHNKRVWRGEEDNDAAPILLVCYTNHALDQFLEGILKSFKGNLVRVGSRSKSKELEDYNLRSIRSRARTNRTVPLAIHVGKQDTRLKMKEMKAEIHLEAAKLEILEREIVTESFLKEFMFQDHFQQMTHHAYGESIIPRWLGIYMLDDRGKKYLEEWRKRLNNPMYAAAAQRRDAVAQHQNAAVGNAAAGNAAAGNAAVGNAAAGNAAAGNGNNQSAEVGVDAQDEDAEYADIDLFGEADAEMQRAQNLAIDNDDDDIDMNETDELFEEILGGLGQDHLQNVKRVNQRLDEVDILCDQIRVKNIAFDVSSYGEEEMPTGLQKKDKKHWKDLTQLKKNYRLKLLHHLQTAEMMTEDNASQIYNIWKIRISDRWRLYLYWVDRYCRQIRGAIRDKSQEYERMARRYTEILHQEDKSILEKATIIGMTSSAAARYQAVLREIGPKIVMVEEAAEVLEGHILTSLSAECQHVILIGDHKQLRPNPSVYKLKTDYNIDISLFERLVNNGFPFDCLKYQHRMRPEISQLLRVKDLYPDLLDHSSVKMYPAVKSLRRDVNFIHHTHHEGQEEDTKTFCNEYEAKFLIELLFYLLHQGYRSSAITVLSPYGGQVHLIKSMLEENVSGKAMALKVQGVKVVSVDNYQGEENDIILLSLVRSNPNDDIGFLKMNNRLCVALSRAKHGLFVIGNLVGLSKKSNLFQEVLTIAKANHLVGSMNHYCLQHPREVTVIDTLEDFRKIPEGGCSLPCGIRLDCGHVCQRICHSDDKDHKMFKCKENCRRMCDLCQQRCFGGHKCGKHDLCWNQVNKTIPACGHEQAVPCYLEVSQFECKQQCGQALPCSHICRQSCGTNHRHTQDTCTQRVKVKPLGCGHEEFEVRCKQNKGDVTLLCTAACGKELECGHLCPGECGGCRNGRLHLNCQQPCQKILICGHGCKAKCSDCPPCSRPCENICSCTSKCPKLCGEPCAQCLMPCKWKCPHHECKELCCQTCERPPCNERCQIVRKCGHKCCGLCGEKCPRLCRVCHKQVLIDGSLLGYDGDEDTTFIELDCGHVLESDFVDQWMDTDTGTDPTQQAIALKQCPVCKSFIRKCNRYNKKIKGMLNLIERVKRKYKGEKHTIEQLEKQRDEVARTFQGDERLIVDIFLAKGGVLSTAILEAQVNQLMLYQQICALLRKAGEASTRWVGRPGGDTFRTILSDLDHFKAWSLQPRSLFSPQNNTDAHHEHGRLSVLLDLKRLEFTIQDHGVRDTIPQRLMTRLGQSITQLVKYKVAPESVIEEGRQLCKELKALVPDTGLALTSEEKRQIVAAMGLTKGAWYKCPKGHVYAIGECGQATEESKCPECKSIIGGQGHRLRTDNQWAPEMDSAQVPISVNFQADRDLAERIERELNMN